MEGEKLGGDVVQSIECNALRQAEDVEFFHHAFERICSGNDKIRALCGSSIGGH